MIESHHISLTIYAICWSRNGLHGLLSHSLLTGSIEAYSVTRGCASSVLKFQLCTSVLLQIFILKCLSVVRGWKGLSEIMGMMKIRKMCPQTSGNTKVFSLIMCLGL